MNSRNNSRHFANSAKFAPPPFPLIMIYNNKKTRCFFFRILLKKRVIIFYLLVDWYKFTYHSFVENRRNRIYIWCLNNKCLITIFLLMVLKSFNKVLGNHRWYFMSYEASWQGVRCTTSLTFLLRCSMMNKHIKTGINEQSIKPT